jgi:hypothetical protein
MTNNKKTKINKVWHNSNRMPEKASLEQRIQWHIKHVRNCECRPMPEGILKIIMKRKIKA